MSEPWKVREDIAEAGGTSIWPAGYRDLSDDVLCNEMSRLMRLAGHGSCFACGARQFTPHVHWCVVEVARRRLAERTPHDSPSGSPPRDSEPGNEASQPEGQEE